jgi:hypothetical protein
MGISKARRPSAMRRQRSGILSVISPTSRKKWLRETAGAAMDKAADLAHKASTAGAQAVDAIQGAACDVGNQASRATSAVYEQGARAGGSVTRYTTEQPLTALLIAAAIGYGIAYLIHRS